MHCIFCNKKGKIVFNSKIMHFSLTEKGLLIEIDEKNAILHYVVMLSQYSYYFGIDEQAAHNLYSKDWK